ncbi:unnamed protein product [Amoebophrya sp. A120]|nr:unnamed protein product [Amoebophrya sp. A120]|eukprot:GSA120T00011148001.1
MPPGGGLPQTHSVPIRVEFRNLGGDVLVTTDEFPFPLERDGQKRCHRGDRQIGPQLQHDHDQSDLRPLDELADSTTSKEAYSLAWLRQLFATQVDRHALYVDLVRHLVNEFSDVENLDPPLFSKRPGPGGPGGAQGSSSHWIRGIGGPEDGSKARNIEKSSVVKAPQERSSSSAAHCRQSDPPSVVVDLDEPHPSGDGKRDEDRGAKQRREVDAIDHAHANRFARTLDGAEQMPLWLTALRYEGRINCGTSSTDSPPSQCEGAEGAATRPPPGVSICSPLLPEPTIRALYSSSTNVGNYFVDFASGPLRLLLAAPRTSGGRNVLILQHVTNQTSHPHISERPVDDDNGALLFRPAQLWYTVDDEEIEIFDGTAAVEHALLGVSAAVATTSRSNLQSSEQEHQVPLAHQDERTSTNEPTEITATVCRRKRVVQPPLNKKFILHLSYTDERNPHVRIRRAFVFTQDQREELARLVFTLRCLQSWLSELFPSVEEHQRREKAPAPALPPVENAVAVACCTEENAKKDGSVVFVDSRRGPSLSSAQGYKTYTSKGTTSSGDCQQNPPMPAANREGTGGTEWPTSRQSDRVREDFCRFLFAPEIEAAMMQLCTASASPSVSFGTTTVPPKASPSGAAQLHSFHQQHSTYARLVRKLLGKRLFRTREDEEKLSGAAPPAAADSSSGSTRQGHELDGRRENDLEVPFGALLREFQIVECLRSALPLLKFIDNYHGCGELVDEEGKSRPSPPSTFSTVARRELGWDNHSDPDPEEAFEQNREQESPALSASTTESLTEEEQAQAQNVGAMSRPSEEELARENEDAGGGAHNPEVGTASLEISKASDIEINRSSVETATTVICIHVVAPRRVWLDLERDQRFQQWGKPSGGQASRGDQPDQITGQQAATEQAGSGAPPDLIAHALRRLLQKVDPTNEVLLPPQIDFESEDIDF